MSDYAFSYDDIDSMINDASSDFDFSNYFSNSDIGNISGLDLPGEFNIDPGAFSFDDIDSMLRDATEGTGGFDAILSAGDFDQAAPPSNTAELIESMGSATRDNLANIDFESLYTEGMTPEQLAKRQELMDLGGQNFGSSVDMDKSMGDFNTNLQDIMDNRGGFTSQWQQVGSDRILVNDDGTGIGINENGDPYALTTREVGTMIKNGQLNTFGSGYNTATGGNKIAPGGGSSVVLKNGQTGQLLTTGKVINADTGKVIGKKEDVANVITTDGDGNKIVVDGKSGGDGKTGGDGKGGGSGSGSGSGGKSGGLSDLLPLLLALLAMNKGGGGGGGSGAVIPGLTATQKQTPYAQQQRAPGYRPGQGGVTYFDQTQYTPKMAAGGIARLLQGPGDGVSDSIPAVIDGGMAGGGQPAKVARGEYILDARSVAALGNGSTDAGAERLDKMRKNILRDDRQAGVGKDSKAYRHLLA